MAWTRGSTSWDSFRSGPSLSKTDLRTLAAVGDVEYEDVGTSQSQIKGISSGMSIVYVDGLNTLDHVLLSSVGLVTKAMARAILNRSQRHVPYDTGELYRSAQISSYGLGAAAETAASPKVAFAGLADIDEKYLPESLTPSLVLSEARMFGFSEQDIDDQIEWRVEYTEDYALSVHEGFVYGKEVQNWTPRSAVNAPSGMGEPTSHFLSNAFVAMAQKQPLLVRGVMQTTLQRLRETLEPNVKQRAAAEQARAAAAARGALGGPVGPPRLRKVKV